MSNVYADCIAQQAKEGIVRGDNPKFSPPDNDPRRVGTGKASNAPAMAKAEFKHNLDDS